MKIRPTLRSVPGLLRAVRQSPGAAPPRPTSTERRPAPGAPSRNLSTTPAAHQTHPSSASSPSVNETEISHFSALASSWWDPHGPSRPLHLMNPLRHDFIRACLSSSSENSELGTAGQLRYLDVGCGGGIFAESAARLPGTHSVTAIDPSPAILAVARAHARRDPSLARKLTYLNETIESLPLPPSTPASSPDDADADAAPAPAPAPPRGGCYYDVVTLFEVIEHVDYPAEFLDRVGRFVNPRGGWLVLSTIARTWTSWLTTNVIAEDVLGVVPRGTHDWNKYINEEELRAFFERKNNSVETGGADAKAVWGPPRVMGVVYVPGLGWKVVSGSEKVGNYFFGVQRLG